MIRIKMKLGARFLAGFAAIVFLLASAIQANAGELKSEKGYTYSLKQLMDQAGKNIEKVDKELRKREIEKANQKREIEAREHFKKGNAIHEEGKLKEAKREWQKALEITMDPEMKDYVKDSEKKARKEELARKKEQREKQRRLESGQREKERLERERRKQLELKKKEKLRRQEEERKRRRRLEKESERREMKKQRQREKEQKKQRQMEQAGQRKIERERQERLEKERIKESRKAVTDTKETTKDTEEETKLRLKDLTYKTKKECLDVLGRDPDDKEAFDNLVNLHLLKDESLDKAKELYRNRDYQKAIQEYDKALLIEPENKNAKTGMKRARSRMK